MYLKFFTLALIIFLILDIVWIRFAAKKLYSEYLGFLTKTSPNLLVGALIYPLIVAGLTFFVIEPYFTSVDPFRGAVVGAFFGLIVYGAYDLTNYSAIKNWPLGITIIDIVWGMTLCASVTAATYYLGGLLGF